MKIFVTGVAGQLGHDIINELYARNENKQTDFFECIGSDLAERYNGVQDGSAVTTAQYVQLDITDYEAVKEVLLEIKPDAVIHCAAWTAVDMAEDDNLKEKVRLVNAVGTENIARVVNELDKQLENGCRMMYTSTDYVFNGLGTEPWEPDCKEYAPLSVYGQTKLDGEIAVVENVEKFFIIRIAWVFGKNGKNFIKTMLNLGKNHNEIKVVSDQIGTPTYTFDLAKLMCEMIVSSQFGYYHATNAEVDGDAEYTADGCKTGYISWYDFTKEIFRQAEKLGYKEYGSNINVIPVSTQEYGDSKAARPFNSRLDKRKIVENGFTPLPTWQDAVSRYLPDVLSEINK